MNAVLAFSAIIAVALCGPVPQNSSEIDGVVDTNVDIVASSERNTIDADKIVDKILDAVDSVVGPQVQAKETDVVYWFFSKGNPANGFPVSKESLIDLEVTPFNASKDTAFIIHGWMNSNTSSFITTVRNAITTNLDVNIFVVDWSDIAAQSYVPARNSVPDVGSFLAEFIKTLISTFKISLSSVTLIGHSLGAQVAGIAGAALDGNAAVIVGLDPALPLFATSGVEDRLDPTDAKYVQVIHTNGGLKGFLSPIGDSDYYPNGGVRQPGCGSDIGGSCAHARAYEYYAESLGGGRFVGVSCGSYSEYTSGACSSGSKSLLGTAQIDTSASGRYYLDTNSESPYAKG